MVGVNATRRGMKRELNNALDGAKLIGFNDEGHVCVWSGGYSFSVYDAVTDWHEVRHFTCGGMVDWKDEEKAREMMESRGYDIIG